MAVTCFCKAAPFQQWHGYEQLWPWRHEEYLGKFSLIIQRKRCRRIASFFPPVFRSSCERAWFLVLWQPSCHHEDANLGWKSICCGLQPGNMVSTWLLMILLRCWISQASRFFEMWDKKNLKCLRRIKLVFYYLQPSKTLKVIGKRNNFHKLRKENKNILVCVLIFLLWSSGFSIRVLFPFPSIPFSTGKCFVLSGGPQAQLLAPLSSQYQPP